jgi:hypothetical protein
MQDYIICGAAGIRIPDCLVSVIQCAGHKTKRKFNLGFAELVESDRRGSW